jgi:hypothetical protein
LPATAIQDIIRSGYEIRTGYDKIMFMRIDARQILGVFGGAVAAASLFVSGEATSSAQTSNAQASSHIATALAASSSTAVQAGAAGAGAADNTLTAAEKSAGWKLLFDGKTPSGWHTYQKKGVTEGWSVVNGELTRTGRGGDLVTDAQYADFELSIDWKIAANGNSGIFYRGLETEERIYYTAPEYQVLDNDGHPDAKNGPDRLAGANYDLIPPSKNVCHPAGQWNSTRILVRGAHVEHWLNGEKVVEYEFWTPEWQALVANNKFKAWPTYGMAKAGHIAIQDHGDTVAFKNIKLRILK